MACGTGDSETNSTANGTTAAPNVILISIDSLRADHCTPYGYMPHFTPNEATTPFMAKLAQEGVLFESMSSSSSWTLPSHLSLFSGLPPREHGARMGRHMLSREGGALLAGQFKNAGYSTYGVWSAPFLHPAYGYVGPNGDEFDSYVTAEPYLDDQQSERIITNEEKGRMMEVHGLADTSVDNSPRVNERAMWFVSQHVEDQPEKPFFMFLHYWDAHYNYTQDEESSKRFLPDFSEADQQLGLNFTPPHGGAEPRIYTEDELNRVKAMYDAEIRAVDDAIAEVYAQLVELGIEDNTIFAIVSDHGDHFGEEHEGSKHMFHHRTLFQEVVHVPFVVRAPGRIEAGARVPGSVALYDVGPTLVELAGLPAWTGITGRSALPLIESAGSHEVLMDLFHPGVPTDSSAWRSGDTKAIWEHGSPPTRQSAGGTQPYFRWYNLAQDPTESSPIEDFAGNDSILKARQQIEAAIRDRSKSTLMKKLPDSVSEGLANTGYVDTIDD